jgi:hypothetical protein
VFAGTNDPALLSILLMLSIPAFAQLNPIPIAHQIVAAAIERLTHHVQSANISETTRS